MGVLGCADIALRRILPNLVHLDSATLVAVSSRHADKAVEAASQFDCAAVTGYEALLARDDIDAVYIPLPPAMHHRWIVESLTAGKHVLAEKPLCVTAAETTEVVELARRHDLVLAENFMFLNHSQHETVRSLVRDGVIGHVRSFSSAFGIPPVNPLSFRYSRNLGGGALLDVGVYPLRAAQLHFPGEFRVVGACRRVDERIGVDVAGGALLSDADGVTVHLEFGFEHAYRTDYTLWGSAGCISVLRAFTPPEHHRPTVRIEEQDRVTELSLPPDNQVRNTLRAFIDAALGRKEAPCGASMVRHATLVDDVRRAAAAHAAAYG
ncbi:oxidoreductase [Saccharothrix sp. ALI-22-I]|nr:oxidoreductase [Saccharothrix sp. ALI-22-I]